MNKIKKHNKIVKELSELFEEYIPFVTDDYMATELANLFMDEGYFRMSVYDYINNYLKLYKEPETY